MNHRAPAGGGARAPVRMMTVVTVVMANWIVRSQIAVQASHLSQGAGIVALAIAGCLLLVGCRSRMRGTTLVAPAVWAGLALATIGAVGTALVWAPGLAEAEAAEPLRFAAMMSLLCPTMAMLGAKRPQDRAWQFIVLSLWVVLALPSGEWLLQSSGEAFEIHPARRWFLAILVALGTINVLATRFWPSGLLLLVAQVTLLADYLPLLNFGAEPISGILIGLASSVAGLALVCLGWPRRKPVKLPLDRAWLDFRDTFGAVWALRIAERLNTTGRTAGSSLRLQWSGFAGADGVPLKVLPPNEAAVLEDALRMLLLRFVSPEWIARRLDRP